jgi:hypothetical protein
MEPEPRDAETGTPALSRLIPAIALAFGLGTGPERRNLTRDTNPLEMTGKREKLVRMEALLRAISNSKKPAIRRARHLRGC